MYKLVFPSHTLTCYSLVEWHSLISKFQSEGWTYDRTPFSFTFEMKR